MGRVRYADIVQPGRGLELLACGLNVFPTGMIEHWRLWLCHFVIPVRIIMCKTVCGIFQQGSLHMGGEREHDYRLSALQPSFRIFQFESMNIPINLLDTALMLREAKRRLALWCHHFRKYRFDTSGLLATFIRTAQ